MLFKYLLVYVISFFGIFTSLFFLLTILENRKRLASPAPPKRFPLVSVIIPAYNEQKCIEKTIRSVVGLDWPGNKLEVLVVDDGSIDSTYAIAKKVASRFGNVKVLRKENGGKATALNFGISKSRGEFIAGLDADSFVSSGALKAMMGHFADPKVMAVTPSLKVHKPGGFWRRIQHVEYMLSIFLRKVFAFLNAIHVTPGPFSIFRKTFFAQHGGFEEDNLTEDIEIALRLQSKHYRIENSIDASVFTVAPPTFKGLLKQRMRWYYGFTKNAVRYKHLFRPSFGDLGMFMLPAAFISVALVLIAGGYFLYDSITNLADVTANLNAIRFDILPFLEFEISNVLRDVVNFITNPLIIFIALSLILSLSLITIAKVKSKDKEPIKLSFCYFFLAYWLLYGFWWLMAFVYKGLGGKIIWGKRKE